MYAEATLSAVREQLERAAGFDLYADRYAEAGLEPSAIDSWEAFHDVPFLTGEDLEVDYEAHAPEGSLYRDAAMLSFTPMGGDLAPVFDTREDLAHQAEVNARVFQAAGIDPGDRVMNTFGYETFGTGVLFHRALEELGAEVVPAGPGDSEAAAATIEEFDVAGLIGNPSFALKIAEAGGRVRTFVGGGEPFTSIPGLRAEVKAALGAETAADYFGTRQILPVAAETTAEDGLHVVDDYAIAEVVDPDTGERLPPGERGELVVTHVRKDAVPLVRYRTGDLTTYEVRDGTVVLPDGVIGRTDQRLKVKGVKVYPESLGTVLAAFDGLTGEYRVEVTRPESTDQLRVVCEGEADHEALLEAISERLIVTPDEVVLADELGESGVVDERY